MHQAPKPTTTKANAKTMPQSAQHTDGSTLAVASLLLASLHCAPPLAVPAWAEQLFCATTCWAVQLQVGPEFSFSRRANL